MSPLCARVSNGFLVLGYSLVFVVWPQIKKKERKEPERKKLTEILFERNVESSYRLN